jgi:integrase
MAKPKGRLYRRLSDTYVARQSDFARAGVLEDFSDAGPIVWDDRVRGLHARFGRHRTTWIYQREHRTHGDRGVTYKRLGFYPAMNLKDARKAALVEAGTIAAGRITPGKRDALKVSDALDQYIDHLRTRKAGSRWPDNVASIARVHIRPEFGTWPLQELSAVPARVASWHKAITKTSGPVVANQAAKVLRAAYRRAARLDRSLPPALPTSAVEFNAETRSQNALDFADFPKWFAAWGEIESPTRKAFQMVNLLSGCRPGELARLKWSDVLPRSRCFVIRDAKGKNDIHVPLSSAIARALKLARNAARADKIESVYVFAARADGHIVKFDCDGLPAHGMALRRTWRTIAADAGIDELIAHFCLGHIPAGISRGYVSKMILASGQGMRAAQRTVSKRIVGLLGKGL